MLFKNPALKLIPAIFLCLCLVIPALPATAAAPPTPPPPQILEAAQARQAASILRQVALSYAPQMSAAERDRDCLQKVTLAKRLLGVRRLVELRQETLALLPPGRKSPGSTCAPAAWPGGDRVGVTLERPGLGAGPGPEAPDLLRL